MGFAHTHQDRDDPGPAIVFFVIFIEINILDFQQEVDRKIATLNIAEWIMAVGIVFGVGLLLLSVVKDDPWQDHVYDNVPPISAGVASPHRGGRQKMVCSSCHEIIDPKLSGRANIIPPIIFGAPAPHVDGREKQTCSHCHKILNQPQSRAQTIAVAQRLPTFTPIPVSPSPDPEMHERFLLSRFQGKIIRVVTKSVQSGRENLNILLNNGINKPTWFNLAPDDYLGKQGCGVQTGLFVKGTSFKEMGRRTPQMQYVKTISVNGHLCLIRDRHMLGMWEPGAVLPHGEE